MPRIKDHKLEIFCREYVQHWNAAKAARSVGISQASASTVGNNWLKKPHVIRRISELVENRIEDFEHSKEEIIAEMNALATFNMGDCYDDDNNLIHPADLPKHIQQCIKEVKTAFNRHTGKTDIVEIKFHDKRSALDHMMKYHNAYEDHQKSGAGEIHVWMDEIDQKA